jgi:hypothetical protein
LVTCAGLIELAVQKNVLIGGDDFKSGQTKMKSVLVDFLVGAGLKPTSIVSYNHLGNNDGMNLSAPQVRVQGCGNLWGLDFGSLSYIHLSISDGMNLSAPMLDSQLNCNVVFQEISNSIIIDDMVAALGGTCLCWLLLCGLCLLLSCPNSAPQSTGIFNLNSALSAQRLMLLSSLLFCTSCIADIPLQGDQQIQCC